MAAGNTYTAIAEQTLGSAAASVTFSSIPGTYTDLVLVVNGAIATGAQDIWVQVNGDTGSNYSRTNMYGYSGGPGSTRLSNQTKFAMYDAAALDNGYQFLSIMQFMNYSNTTTYKTMLERANNAARGVDAGVHLWRSTAAINSIYVYNSGATNYIVGTTFTLYGIASA